MTSSPGPPWSVIDDDRRRRRTPATVTSLAPTLCVCGPVINWKIGYSTATTFI